MHDSGNHHEEYILDKVCKKVKNQECGATSEVVWEIYAIELEQRKEKKGQKQCGKYTHTKTMSIGTMVSHEKFAFSNPVCCCCAAEHGQ